MLDCVISLCYLWYTVLFIPISIILWAWEYEQTHRRYNLISLMKLFTGNSLLCPPPQPATRRKNGPSDKCTNSISTKFWRFCWWRLCLQGLTRHLKLKSTQIFNTYRTNNYVRQLTSNHGLSPQMQRSKYCIGILD